MKEERFAIFPVRGIWMEHTDVSSALLDRDWALVNPYATDAINNLVPGGFGGNIEQLRDRMKATTLLIVRRYLDLEKGAWSAWQDVSDHAERVLSALNLILLANPISQYDTGAGDGVGAKSTPSPVWLTRVPEHPELPLIFGRDRLWSTGHSQMLSWPTLPHLATQGTRTMADVDVAISYAHPFLQRLLQGRVSESYESAARAFMLSFNSTTHGQFIAQALGALDILFGENDSARWASMDSYVSTLCRSHASGTLISTIFQMRHRFIHRHREPDDPNAHLVALAVITCSFLRWSALLSDHEDHVVALDVLEALTRLGRAAARKPNDQPVLDALHLLGAPTPNDLPQWIADWLSPDTRPA